MVHGVNQNLDLVDEIFAPSYTVNARHVGPEGVRAAVQHLHQGFGEPTLAVEDLLGEADKVVVRWRIQSRHNDVLFGIPATGRTIELTGTNIYRISADRIVENWETSTF
jgi:predicted ester cyclase